MGEYEDQLAQLASLDRWQFPGLDAVILALNEVKISYDRLGGETGFQGKTDDEIKTMLDNQGRFAAQSADALGAIPDQIEAANAALLLAKQAHLDLPDATIDPELKKTILAGSWLAGPFGALAGHEGVRIWEKHLADEREAAAKKAVESFDADITAPTRTTVESTSNTKKPSDGGYHGDEAQNRQPFTPITPTTPGGPTTPARPKTPTTPSSFGKGGDDSVDPGTEVFPPPPPRPPVDPPVITDPGTIDIPGGTDPGVTGPGDGTGPGGSGPGGSSPSVDGGLGGSVAGAGGLAGAAGLAGGARLASRLAGGAAGAGGMGVPGLGGLGAGGLGAGGLGAGGMGSGPGAAGQMGSGGGAGSAGGRGSGAGASAGGRGGQSMMSHGQGGQGGGDSEKKKRPSGLLGLTAPTLDDDGDPTLRSAAAGPGARGGRSGRATDDSAIGYSENAAADE